MSDVHSLIGVIVVGIIVGWTASKLVHGKGLGLLGDMVVGIVGAFIGTLLADKLHIHILDGAVGDFLQALLGAVVLLVVIRLFGPSK